MQLKRCVFVFGLLTVLSFALAQDQEPLGDPLDDIETSEAIKTSEEPMLQPTPSIPKAQAREKGNKAFEVPVNPYVQPKAAWTGQKLPFCKRPSPQLCLARNDKPCFCKRNNFKGQ